MGLVFASLVWTVQVGADINDRFKKGSGCRALVNQQEVLPLAVVRTAGDSLKMTVPGTAPRTVY